MFERSWLTGPEVIAIQQTKELSVAGAELKQVYPTEEINVIWKKISKFVDYWNNYFFVL